MLVFGICYIMLWFIPSYDNKRTLMQKVLDDKENEFSSTLNQIKLAAMFTILIFIDIEYGWSLNYHLLTWGSTLIAFDLFANATVVYLLFQYNSSKYYTICKICHRGCERICVECIYCYSKRSKQNGINNAQSKDRQEFATLILTADDDTAVL